MVVTSIIDLFTMGVVSLIRLKDEWITAILAVLEGFVW
jgi:hypothetical protein